MRNDTEKFSPPLPASATILGIECWNLDETAKVAGVHKNTILNWIKRTRKGQLNMPILGGKLPHSKIFVPIKEFMDWYELTY